MALLASLFVTAATAMAPATIDDAALATRTLALAAQSEIVATITASCAECDWQRKGQEAAALVVNVDGRYSQHLFLTRGARPAPYRIALGRLEPGTHQVEVRIDRTRSARKVRAAMVESLELAAIDSASPQGRRLAHSPFVYIRRDTIGRFSDVPLIMYVEEDQVAAGTRLRYTVVFSNEDGGTPADRLLATWGRLTDIEYVYGVVTAADGAAVSSEFQAPGHAIEPFHGRREGDHPLMWVVTKNNMVDTKGGTGMRFAPAPVLIELASVSREVAMDREPWTYRVSAQEARREGRVKGEAAPGKGRIVDPRRYLTLEACAPATDAVLSFSVRARRRDGTVADYDSSGGLANFRIAREPIHFPTGCFRGAVALPPGATAADVVSLAIRAHTRPPRDKGETPLAPGSGAARLAAVNALFFLNGDDEPDRTLLQWRGDAALRGEGPAYEIPVPAKAVNP